MHNNLPKMISLILYVIKIFSKASSIENSDSFSLIQFVIEQLKFIDEPKQGCRYAVNMVKTAFCGN